MSLAGKEKLLSIPKWSDLNIATTFSVTLKWVFQSHRGLISTDSQNEASSCTASFQSQRGLISTPLQEEVLLLCHPFNPNVVWFQLNTCVDYVKGFTTFNPNVVWFQLNTCVDYVKGFTTFNPNVVWFERKFRHVDLETQHLSIPTWSDFNITRQNPSNLSMLAFNPSMVWFERRRRGGLIWCYCLSIPAWSDLNMYFWDLTDNIFDFQSQHGLIWTGYLFPSIHLLLYKSFPRSALLVVDPRLCTSFIKNHDFSWYPQLHIIKRFSLEFTNRFPLQ